MRIATYNVNGITARLPRLLEWLDETRPDVACLQELKTSDETFPVDALEAAGYGAAWVGQKAWNGVAILARDATPAVRLRALPGGGRPAASLATATITLAVPAMSTVRRVEIKIL